MILLFLRVRLFHNKLRFNNISKSNNVVLDVWKLSTIDFEFNSKSRYEIYHYELQS